MENPGLTITKEQEQQLCTELEQLIKRTLADFGPELSAETYIYDAEGELISIISF